MLIFDACDFKLGAQTALNANFYTAGEMCSNAARVFVQCSIADNFITALIAKAEVIRVGDPMAKETQMGALISARHLGEVLNYVEVGVTEGATIATGGQQL